MDNTDLRTKLRAKISVNKMSRLPKGIKEEKIEKIKTQFSDILSNMSTTTKP